MVNSQSRNNKIVIMNVDRKFRLNKGDIEVEKILTPEIQTKISELMTLNILTQFIITLEDDVLKIRINKILDKESDYDKLIEIGLNIANNLEGRDHT